MKTNYNGREISEVRELAPSGLRWYWVWVVGGDKFASLDEAKAAIDREDDVIAWEWAEIRDWA